MLKSYTWDSAKCVCKIIIFDSVIMCDEIIETTTAVSTKSIPTDFNEKIWSIKWKKICI